MTSDANYHVLRAGWLLKAGEGVFRVFNKRYFELTPDALTYSASPAGLTDANTSVAPDAATTPVVIPTCSIYAVSNIAEAPAPAFGRAAPPFGFFIHTLERRWELFAADQTDRVAWISLISRAIPALYGSRFSGLLKTPGSLFSASWVTWCEGVFVLFSKFRAILLFSLMF
jgi:hypothetical protein